MLFLYRYLETNTQHRRILEPHVGSRIDHILDVRLYSQPGCLMYTIGRFPNRFMRSRLHTGNGSSPAVFVSGTGSTAGHGKLVFTAAGNHPTKNQSDLGIAGELIEIGAGLTIADKTVNVAVRVVYFAIERPLG